MAHVLPGGKYNSIQDVIADAKARPGKQTWTIIGSPMGDDAIRVKQFTEPLGINIKVVGFENAGKAHAAVLGGHVDVLTEEVGPVSGLLEAKKITPVMVFAEKRLEAYPDVPTTKELGAEAYMGPTRGLVAKKGTPKPIIQYLHDAFKESMESSLYKDYVKANHLDLRPGYLGPEDCLKWLHEEAEFYADVYKKAGVYKIVE
jgi:tripartite-type tricarboxylate transporter receptor subunit TctC